MARDNFFQRQLAFYVRQLDGGLIDCLGPAGHQVKAVWQDVRAVLPSAEDGLRGMPQPVRVDVMHQLGQSFGLGEGESVVAYEKMKSRGNEVFGVVLAVSGGALEDEARFDAFFAYLALTAMDLGADVNCLGAGADRLGAGADGPEEGAGAQPATCDYDAGVTEAIVKHFDVSLRYITQGDLWDAQGRDYFRQRVEYFTKRGQPIQLCLPAFPCKSSNLNKVQGTAPDRGEYIALTNLHRFVEGIEALYPPGGKLWIVSDGHVFSDCIGVDDDLVDDYGAKLIAMNESIRESRGGAQRIGFKSLLDLFDVDGWQRESSRGVAELAIPQIDHHIATRLGTTAELCRRILMLGFQPDGQELRRQVDAQDPVVLPLYRGFSRFMFEDLEVNCYTQSLSRSQRRRLSSKVAFEMIQRNHAYSNLVEVMFPNHIRLSIHAHANCGPKFGIQVFGPGVKPTNELSSDGQLMSSNDLLHVPTPWHNCVVEVANHPTLYVTKSATARAAMASGQFGGGWTGGKTEHGGCFELAIAAPKMKDTKTTAISYAMPVYGVVGETATMAEVGCV